MAGEVRADRVVQHGRVGFERLLGIDHGGQRLVLHLHQLRRVLGEIPVARDDDGHGLADETDLVGGRAVIVDGRGHADREGPGLLRHVLAGDHGDHALGGARPGDVVPDEARVRVPRAHDRRVMDVADGRMIVDERSASREKAEILDAPDGLADPAIAHEGRRTLVRRELSCQARLAAPVADT